MKKFWIISLLVLLVLLPAFYFVQKVPAPTGENTYSMILTVDRIYTPCCEDVIFDLSGDDHVNYINRGLEQNIDLRQWSDDYRGKEMIFTFIKHKKIIGIKSRTIAKIEFQNQIIYDAIT